MESLTSTHILEIRTSTWLKDTHGLFDYDTHLLNKSQFSTSAAQWLVRLGDSCHLQDPEAVQHSEDSSVLLSITPTKTEFMVNYPDLPRYLGEPTEPIWLVVRYLKQQGHKGYELKEGDTIKLGRVRLQVKVIELFASGKPQRQILETKSHNVGLVDESEPQQCRICLFENSEEEDPLICPCKCSGSMKYIHLKCLQEWLKNKIVMRQSGKAASYEWKDLTCELCKEGLSPIIKVGDETRELISIEYPNRPYMILEDFRSERTESHALHVVTLNTGSVLTIGRGHNSDIKLSDISVSRQHAKVKFSNGSFYIEDVNSKFGTLIEVVKPILINKEITLEVNRHLLNFHVKKPWNWNSCCGCVKKKVQPEYEVVTEHDAFGDNARRYTGEINFEEYPVREDIEEVDLDDSLHEFKNGYIINNKDERVEILRFERLKEWMAGKIY